VGDFTRSVTDGIAGLLAGAATALVDAFWTIVHQGQVLLPGPLFPLAVGGALLALIIWTFRK
jgi:hypothetical protein